ncbi:hypothetical protein [Methylobrevis albus]|uniref:Uncharacterized protein n=1 Tax=Methylobrevis albus TaxID=2793297 RepID=A0A931HYQ6_9HYPH|nr:hypothetical protein [Methylobrevis albus]MBH0236397.1 hypothetical protein [Methylobrevis albus]
MHAKAVGRASATMLILAAMSAAQVTNSRAAAECTNTQFTPDKRTVAGPLAEGLEYRTYCDFGECYFTIIADSEKFTFRYESNIEYCLVRDEIDPVKYKFPVPGCERFNRGLSIYITPPETSAPDHISIIYAADRSERGAKTEDCLDEGFPQYNDEYYRYERLRNYEHFQLRIEQIAR